MNIKVLKQVQKKNSDELQDYLLFRKRGSIVKSKKGKGSYSRKAKHKKIFENS